MTERRLLKDPPMPKGKKLASWRQGVEAQLNGVFLTDNPHKPGSNDRKHWFNGWYDTWRILKWGPLESEKAVEKFIREQLEKS